MITFAADGATTATTTLHFLPDSPWWNATDKPTVGLVLQPPSVWRRAPWALFGTRNGDLHVEGMVASCFARGTAASAGIGRTNAAPRGPRSAGCSRSGLDRARRRRPRAATDRKRRDHSGLARISDRRECRKTGGRSHRRSAHRRNGTVHSAGSDARARRRPAREGHLACEARTTLSSPRRARRGHGVAPSSAARIGWFAGHEPSSLRGAPARIPRQARLPRGHETERRRMSTRQRAPNRWALGPARWKRPRTARRQSTKRPNVP